MTEKEEITSTEFPEGGNTTYTKGPPASQQGAMAGRDSASLDPPSTSILIPMENFMLDVRQKEMKQYWREQTTLSKTTKIIVTNICDHFTENKSC